jgi:hypothetical protein
LRHEDAEIFPPFGPTKPVIESPISLATAAHEIFSDNRRTVLLTSIRWLPITTVARNLQVANSIMSIILLVVG